MGCLFGVVCVCILTVSNALRMSSATVIARSGGLFPIYVSVSFVFLCLTVLVKFC